MSTTARHRSTEHSNQAGKRGRRKGQHSRFAAKILATVALVVAAGTVAGVGTFGAFTDTTNADMAVSSGKVSVTMNGGDTGIHVDANNMALGDAVVFPVTIRRTAGSLQLGDLTLQTSVTNQNALADALRVTVDACTVPWTTSGSTLTCSGTTTNVSANSGISGNGSVSAWGQTNTWLGALNSDNPVYLRATLSLPDTTANSATAGMSTGITWKLTGSQRTAKTTLVTPAAS